MRLRAAAPWVPAFAGMVLKGDGRDDRAAVSRRCLSARSCAARVVAVDERGIRLDRTVFYPTGGGQPGDTGVLRLATGERSRSSIRSRATAPTRSFTCRRRAAALPEPGAELTAEIDWERRHRLMRMHTCLHLLCSIVPGAVTGGQVADGRGRLDFDVPGSSLDKETLCGRAQRADRRGARGRRRGGSPTPNSPPSPSWCARCRSSRRAGRGKCG